MEKTIDSLRYNFKEIHARVGVLSISHLKELETEISSWRTNGKLSDQFYSDNLGFFRFSPPAKLTKAQSIIILAVPQKITFVTFKHKGKEHQVIIPPTYIYSKLREHCKQTLMRTLHLKEDEIARCLLPLKLLAVRSGLGRYGRNNLFYANDLGSFHRLEAFYTNKEFDVDHWTEKTMLDRCSSCSLCSTACPTGCIPPKQMFIDAEHCLTNLNENTKPFPTNLDPRSHNALIGCMRCQFACPENKRFLLETEQKERFSEEETTLILNNTSKEKLPEETLTKIKHLDMEEYYTMIPRNLSVLLNR
jgi:epoxyqueuosine reductase